jgi:ElaB/YqjD/DUF883 family membrane-anchored ribosome-binding protein
MLYKGAAEGDYAMNKSGTEKFFSDLKTVIETAEELLRTTAHDAGEKAAGAREQARDKLRAARDQLGDLEQNLVSEAQAQAKAADHFVHENPWRSIGVVAGLAFALGVLMGRRR